LAIRRTTERNLQRSGRILRSGVIADVTCLFYVFLENVTPCSLVVVRKFKPWRWRKQVAPELWELSARLNIHL
jgi:hypothetical protein